MKKICILIFSIFSLIFLFYVSLPNFNFPTPPPDSVQSSEPADMESPLRRAYFTNYTREEVLAWYKSQFNYSSLFNVKIPTYLLNYPPEESQTIIRDQTRSTFLQEIVHPFRESMYINGYEPASNDDQNRIVINGVHWRQKLIVKYIPSNLVLRLILATLTLVFTPIIVRIVMSEFLLTMKIWKKH